MAADKLIRSFSSLGEKRFPVHYADAIKHRYLPPIFNAKVRKLRFLGRQFQKSGLLCIRTLQKVWLPRRRAFE